jgi:hypothetical protein
MSLSLLALLLSTSSSEGGEVSLGKFLEEE